MFQQLMTLHCHASQVHARTFSIPQQAQHRCGMMMMMMMMMMIATARIATSAVQLLRMCMKLNQHQNSITVCFAITLHAMSRPGWAHRLLYVVLCSFMVHLDTYLLCLNDCK